MKKRILAALIAALMALQLAGCSRLADFPFELLQMMEQQESEPEEAQEEEQDEAPRYQDDYYEYVNHDLLSLIDLTASDAHWDWFGELDAMITEEMQDIIRDLAASDTVYEKGSSEQKIKDLYECISDVDNRNETGLGPLAPYMDSIRNASTIDEYVDALTRLSGDYGFSSIVGGYSIMQDEENSNEYAVYLMYADTLVGKEYIEGTDTQDYVEVYFKYVHDLMVEYGMSEEEAAAAAESIETLLRDICASTLSTEQSYDPSITYNVYTAQELQELYSNIDMDKMLKTLKLDGQDKYIVMDVEQAKKINSLLTEENLEALKAYSTFVLLNDTAQYTGYNGARLYDEVTHAQYGITEYWGDEWVWMDLTQELLPWDFGMIYVEKYFSAEDKKAVEEIIDLILEEYKTIIYKQDWMSDATKAKAVRKLETMQVKIGYPDEWPVEKDFIQVTPVSEGGSLISNLLAGFQVSIEHDLNKLGTPVDKSQWDETPQTINAMYSPLNNEIIFPAAILQAPFYDSENSYGANMGGIGYVIAHEVSHAFDSTGALYDEYGNYNVWWTDEEFAEYKKRSESIIAYYDNYEMIGIPIDGELTLMENIADLGAINCIASIIGDDSEALDEAFSQMAYNWACEDTASFLLYQIRTDTHAPNKIRVNAVLSSCDAFYEVYPIKKSDGMYVAPEDRVGIWR